MRILPLLAPRGIIYDRNGRVIVTTRPAYSVSLVVLEQNRQGLEAVIQRLAPLLEMSPDEIRARVDAQAKAGRLFEPVRLKTDIGPALHTAIEERRLELPGVFVDVQPVRDYLLGDLAAQVIGYLGEISKEQLAEPRYAEAGYQIGDVIGQSGIEAVYEEYLRGTKGGRRVVVDARGRLIEVQGQRDPVPGSSLVLTLDAGLQAAATRALLDSLTRMQTHPLEQYRSPEAKAGAVVVLGVKTGEVLAMVSVPSIDPNLFVSEAQRSAYFRQLVADPLAPLTNRAVAGAYPPGSTMKMAIAAAALEEGLIRPDDTVFCPGYYDVPGDRKKDWKETGHGAVDVRSALKVSCNVFFYEMARRLARDPRTGREWQRVDPFGAIANRLGLGVPTGFAIGPERRGTFPTQDIKARLGYDDPRWYPSEIVNLGIGQGFNDYTPLQMAIYAATIANGGTRYRPYIVQQVLDRDGRVVWEAEPEVMGTADLPPEVLAALREGMLLAATATGGPGGSGTAAHLFWNFPVKVAGKTGTAQVGTVRQPRPAHGWFVSFAPYDDPEIAVAVIVEHGMGGALSAAPVAKAVYEHYFGLTAPAPAPDAPAPEPESPPPPEPPSDAGD